MYVCKHCGFVSRNESINYCNNIKCPYYGYCQKGEECGRYREDEGERGYRDEKSMPYQDMNFMMPARPKRDYSPMGEHANRPQNPAGEHTGKPAFAVLNQNNNSCGMLGFATVPSQAFGETLPLNDVLKAGTIFPELSMPYDKKIIRRY